MIDRILLEQCTDEASLVKLVESGLGWPVDPDEAFQLEPEIAKGVKTQAQLTVSRLIPASANDKYLVLLVEFSGPYLRRHLREVLASIRRHIRDTGRFSDFSGMGDTIFIVAGEKYSDIRFVLFTEAPGKLPRIRSFGWRPGEQGGVRTLMEFNLPALRMPPVNLLGEPDWSLAKWEEAWNVERVTDEFLKHYHEVFKTVKGQIKGLQGDPHLFTQRLFNRLMFIRFLEKKGWLKYGGDTDYLFALRAASKANGENLYSERLWYAFFCGLGTPGESSQNHNVKFWKQRRGEVPYLNGGLFELEEDDEFGRAKIPNEALDPVFELFARWNFTVTESTPLDVDVAVDPEMLGKVFEELVTGRHESGSYYTPRPVVSFMCREALKGYLAQDGIDASLVARLVDKHDDEGLTQPVARKLLARLLAVKAVDPACGSGAYLLGLLHEIFELVGLLEVTAKPPTERDLYHRKLQIIQNCIYGVDLDVFAVNIARLRLWLSLVVEFQGDVPEPLPNLDFKIEKGDSLLPPDPMAVSPGNLAFRASLIPKFLLAKAAFFAPDPKADKAALRKEILDLKKDIAQFTHGGDGTEFDWAVDFAEVFQEEQSPVTLGGTLNLGPEASAKGQTELAERGRLSGFDIVVANPPYVRANPHGLSDDDAAAAYEYRRRLKALQTYKTLQKKWDIYIPFVERGFQLLRAGGRIVYIIPDAFNTAAYAESSRQFYLSEGTIARVDFCSGFNIFRAGVQNTIVQIVRDPGSSEHCIRVRRNKSFENEELLESGPQDKWGHSIFRAEATPASARPEGDTVLLSDIMYISFGVRPSVADEHRHNVQFFKNDIVKSERLAVPCRTFVDGDCLSRWVVDHNLYIEWGTSRSPALLYRRTFLELQETTPRILSLKICADRPRSAMDSIGHVFDSTVVGLMPWHALKGVRNQSIRKSAKYIDEGASPDTSRESKEEISLAYSIGYVLAVMNSKSAAMHLQSFRRSKHDICPDDWKMLPVPVANSEEQKQITDLVDSLLNGQIDAAVEKEIDGRVEFLYLHRQGTETYEQWVARREAEKGTAIDVIRQLVKAGESGSLEFKQSLEYVEPGGFAQVPEAQRKQKITEAQKAVTHSALKTLCAFLNSKGGTLLLGVHDCGSLIGIEPDFAFCKKPNADGFELRLTDFIKTRLSPLPTAIDIRCVEIDGKTICRIDVPPSKLPTYLDNELYVRFGNSSEKLTGKQLQEWLQGRE